MSREHHGNAFPRPPDRLAAHLARQKWQPDVPSRMILPAVRRCLVSGKSVAYPARRSGCPASRWLAAPAPDLEQVSCGPDPGGQADQRLRDGAEIVARGGAGAGCRRDPRKQQSRSGGIRRRDRTSAPAAAAVGQRRGQHPVAAGGQTLVRMTHRHLAIFRSRVKPYRAYNSSGPVCR